MSENEQRKETAAERKERIRNRYKGIDPDELEVIHARPVEDFYQDTREKRVAVYARVSTYDPRQTSSYELQKNHYENLVSRHEGWNLVEIYADEGISGTSLEHRDAFNKMIKDCEEGKIDLIVTKSVSRFARNILDSVGKVRELKELNPPVGVFFETENIYTLNKDSEMSLSFISTLAQEESHTKSEIMNSSIEMRFRMGIFLKPALLGYGVDEEGNLVINEEEAKIVRLVFFLYLYGYTTQQIADTLTEICVPTKKGNLVWSAGTINEILKNERHCGDILARKTFTPNYLNHKSKKNRMDRNQYLKKDDHEGIISRSDFIAVQHMMKNARFRNRGVLPELEVISSGELSGFVIVNPRWGAFTKEDYMNACKSVDGYDRPDRFEVQEGDFDLRGFEVARTQFFNVYNLVTCSITSRSFQFSCTAIEKLPKTEFIEMLINPLEKLLVIRPTTAENRNAIRWVKKVGVSRRPYRFSSAAFIPTFYEMLGWDKDKRYKISGIRRHNEEQTILIFDLEEIEIYIPVEKAASGGIDESAASKGSVRAYPPDWVDEFGQGYYEMKVKTSHTGKLSGQTQQFVVYPDLTVTPESEIKENIDSLISELKEKHQHAVVDSNPFIESEDEEETEDGTNE